MAAQGLWQQEDAEERERERKDLSIVQSCVKDLAIQLATRFELGLIGTTAVKGEEFGLAHIEHPVCSWRSPQYFTVNIQILDMETKCTHMYAAYTLSIQP